MIDDADRDEIARMIQEQLNREREQRERHDRGVYQDLESIRADIRRVEDDVRDHEQGHSS